MTLTELEADLHKAQEAEEMLQHYRDSAVADHKKAAAAVQNLRERIKSRLIEGEVSDSFELRNTAPRVHITGPVPDAFMVTPAPTPDKTAIKRHLQEGGDTNWAQLVGGKALHPKPFKLEMPDVGF